MDFHEDFEAELFDKPYLTKTKAQIIKFLYKPLKIVSLIMFDRIILAEESYKKSLLICSIKLKSLKTFLFPLNLSLRIKQKKNRI